LVWFEKCDEMEVKVSRKYKIISDILVCITILVVTTLMSRDFFMFMIIGLVSLIAMFYPEILYGAKKLIKKIGKKNGSKI
jgi:hypothetical protein